MKENFFETIPGESHTLLHKRVWDYPGCVVDLGCKGWDWSEVFQGKKRIVGADPLEEGNSKLFRGMVGPCCGDVHLSNNGVESSVLFRSGGAEKRKMISWKGFLQWFDLDDIAVLKMNIEGSEWPLIMSMDGEDFDRIDQIAVSFHHFRWPAMAKATAACGAYIESLGFDSIVTRVEYGWQLFLKR